MLAVHASEQDYSMLSLVFGTSTVCKKAIMQRSKIKNRIAM